MKGACGLFFYVSGRVHVTFSRGSKEVVGPLDLNKHTLLACMCGESTMNELYDMCLSTNIP